MRGHADNTHPEKENQVGSRRGSTVKIMVVWGWFIQSRRTAYYVLSIKLIKHRDRGNPHSFGVRKGRAAIQVPR